MSQKNACPVCGSSSISTFLTREQVPVHQNLPMENRESAIDIARGDLNMAVCHDCGFVFNRTFELSRLSYGKLYDNNQAYSPYFSGYLDSFAHHLIFEKNVQNCQITEVGCGSGSFLRRLVEIKETGNRGYGFDPSYVGPATDLGQRLKFEKSYYGTEHASIHADVVICRHVIEHVPTPLLLLHTMRTALVNSPQARVFLETPCLEWILRNQIIWDFFYEHCSLFTINSLTTAIETEGFELQSVRHVFGGQYLYLEATTSNKKGINTKKPGSIPQLAREFGEAEDKLKRKWRTEIQALLSKGKVAIWGAGAKGVTFANLVDPDRELIDCVVDLNPNKQGKYLPGAGHLIVNPQELAQRGVVAAILMNSNYRDEIRALLREARLTINLIE